MLRCMRPHASIDPAALFYTAASKARETNQNLTGDLHSGNRARAKDNFGIVQPGAAAKSVFRFVPVA